MAATALTISTGKTKSTGGGTTSAVGPITGLTVTITVRTTT